MAETQWREADRGEFERAWEAELADVPVFATSTMHMVAGLLLPIWKRLPQESTRVYRLQTDDGERIVGRRVSPAWAATASANDNGPVLAPDAAPLTQPEDRFCTQSDHPGPERPGLQPVLSPRSHRPARSLPPARGRPASNEPTFFKGPAKRPSLRLR